MEEKSTGGSVSITYVLGHDVLGQANAADVPTPNALKYLLKDGHGTTRLFASDTGTIAERYDFQAFGEPVYGFDVGNAATTSFFADGPRDKETSFTYSLFRYRRGFEFISSDDGRQGDTSDPVSLHKYLYTPDNPVNFGDPTGHDFSYIGSLSANGIATALSSLQATGFNAVYTVVSGVEAGLNADQIFGQFLIGEAIGIGLGFGLGLLAKGIGALREGISVNVDFRQLFARSRGVSTIGLLSEASGGLASTSPWRIKPGTNIKDLNARIQNLEKVWSGGAEGFVPALDYKKMGLPLYNPEKGVHTFGLFTPAEFAGAETVTIRRGATLGTYVEELIHAVQVRAARAQGKTITREWIEANREAMEQEAKNVLRSFGFYEDMGPLIP